MGVGMWGGAGAGIAGIAVSTWWGGEDPDAVMQRI